MKTKLSQYSIFLLLSSLFLLFFTDTRQSIKLTTSACSIWWNRMIPSLFPFMVISRCMIQTKTSFLLGKLFGIILKPIFRLSDQCIYIIVIGFLCGFPMGAIVINDSLEQNYITKDEANLLLTFCNNIGPAYVISFAYILCPYYSITFIIFLMYAIPLCIGLFLRHTIYKNKILYSNRPMSNNNTRLSLAASLNLAITDSISAMLSLLGCMIIFTIIQLPLYNKNLTIPNTARVFLTGFLEISSGIQNIANYKNLYPYVYILLLPLCGLCCLYQTSIISKNNSIKIHSYIIGKIVHSTICSIIFLFQ